MGNLLKQYSSNSESCACCCTDCEGQGYYSQCPDDATCTDIQIDCPNNSAYQLNCYERDDGEPPNPPPISVPNDKKGRFYCNCNNGWSSDVPKCDQGYVLRQYQTVVSAGCVSQTCYQCQKVITPACTYCGIYNSDDGIYYTTKSVTFIYNFSQTEQLDSCSNYTTSTRTQTMYIDEQGFCQSRITYEGSSSSNSSVQYGQGEYTTYATSSCNSYQDIYGTWYNTSYITDARGNTTASSSNTECYGCYLGNGGGNFSTSYDGFAPCKCPDGYSVGDNGKDCVWVGNYADAPSQVSNPVSQNILDMYKPTPIDQNSVATPTPTSTNTQADLPVFIIGTPPPGA